MTLPGERRREPSIERRIAALEAAVGEKKGAPAKTASALDVTGVVVGLSLLAVGALLGVGSIDLLRNPLLALTAGFVILACALWRLVFK